MKVTDSRRPKLTVLHQIRHAIEGGEPLSAGRESPLGGPGGGF